MVSKERVIDAAIKLFNTKGYTGTSVREIANLANTNVALISYYFGNKQGLLEYLMIEFLEKYVNTLESHQKNFKKGSFVFDQMLQVIWNVMIFQQKNYELSRFVHRELTLDTVLVRELMSSYLAKEKHFFHLLFEQAYDEGELIEEPSEFFVLQLRGLLTMPFQNPQYIQEVYHLMPYEIDFLDEYFSVLAQWIASHFKEHVITNSKATVQVPLW